jgi:hypothetical protein
VAKPSKVRIDTEPEFRAGKPALVFAEPFHESENPVRPYYDVAPGGEHFIMAQEKLQTRSTSS